MSSRPTRLPRPSAFPVSPPKPQALSLEEWYKIIKFAIKFAAVSAILLWFLGLCLFYAIRYNFNSRWKPREKYFEIHTRQPRRFEEVDADIAWLVDLADAEMWTRSSPDQAHRDEEEEGGYWIETRWEL